MNRDIKKEAMKNYFHYFRIWFIITGVIVGVTLIIAIIMLSGIDSVRKNNDADKERVFDYADVLTDAEEQDMREYIAKCEKKAHIDIVLITINEPVEDSGLGWDYAMMNIADDAYDNGLYGWNKKHGDGALLLDNWYEDENGSQKGSWLSTSGMMESNIGSWEEDRVFSAMDEYIESDPYRAYRAAIGKLIQYSDYGTEYEGSGADFYFGAFIISTIVAVSYASVCLSQGKPKDTTTPKTYVENGRPVIRSKEDIYLRKSLSSHKIQSSSGGGGHSSGHSGGGSYGHHTSSGGHSHGGGGHRR